MAVSWWSDGLTAIAPAIMVAIPGLVCNSQGYA